jgi:hypothetical protein
METDNFVGQIEEIAHELPFANLDQIFSLLQGELSTYDCSKNYHIEKFTLQNRITIIREKFTEKGYTVIGLRQGAKDQTSHLLVFELCMTAKDKPHYREIIYNSKTDQFTEWDHEKFKRIEHVPIKPNTSIW